MASIYYGIGAFLEFDASHNLRKGLPLEEVFSQAALTIVWCNRTSLDKAIAAVFDASAITLEATALRLEAIAIRLETITRRLEAIAIGLETIAF